MRSINNKLFDTVVFPELRQYVEVRDNGYISATLLSKYIKENHVRKFNLAVWCTLAKVQTMAEDIEAAFDEHAIIKADGSGRGKETLFHPFMAVYFIEQTMPEANLWRYNKLKKYVK